MAKAATNTFMDKLYADAFRAGLTKGTKESEDWFRKKLAKVKSVNRQELLKDENFITRASPQNLPGRLFMYFYDPKTKKELPYYDRFPLTFLAEKAKGGFYGLNMHYLHPRQRAIFFDKLTDYATGKSDKQRLKLTYNLLKGTSKLKEFQPCFKHYLSGHIRSKIVEIPSSEWEAVMYLPTEFFMKKPKTTVFARSRKQYS